MRCIRAARRCSVIAIRIFGWLMSCEGGPMVQRRDYARLALATIRLVNGGLALFAPDVMLRRLGADPATNGVAVHPLRMFGIRTVLLGLGLLTGGATRQQGKAGVVIHGADAMSAITAGCGGSCRRGLPSW